MQPNNQQGYYQPGRGQPAQPVVPPVPAPQPAQSVAPTQQPVVEGSVPAVDSAAIQAALDEPGLASNVPVPSVTLPSSGEPVGPEGADDQGDDELSEAPVTWVAHEFIHREKGAMWFMIFTFVVLGLAGISIWTQAWSFTALIAVIAVLVIVYSRRPPRELTYSLTDEGLTIDGKLQEFSAFKSFGVIHDGEEYSVMLIPVQRFQPGISVYFPEEAGKDIVDALGSVLPMKELKLDVIDRIVRLLRL